MLTIRLSTLKAKVETAAIIGTLQATLTDFRYLRNVWKKNTEEEALLGLSMTGIMDHPIIGSASDKTEQWLEELKDVAVKTNKKVGYKARH